MSIKGIGGAVGHPGRLPGQVADTPRELEKPAIQKPSNPTKTAEPSGTSSALSAEAPPGTDPALWQVLTAEERSFFAKANSIGLLTYAPSRSADAGAATIRGGRIDLKV